MTKALLLVGLEFYALLLAVVQSIHHVWTDEAKYLLNIPYPHPPLGRWIFGITEFLPFSKDLWQEYAWRFILASLLVQAVWIVWCGTQRLSYQSRISLCFAWLCSSAVVFEGGAILMATLTAVQGLILLSFFLPNRTYGWRDGDYAPSPLSVGLLWLASLFTAYQAILFSPLLLGILQKCHIPRWKKVVLFGGPVFLLILYSLSNPLSLASMMTHVQKDGADPIFWRFLDTVKIWALGGSIFLSVFGTWGLLSSRSWPLVGSFLLVFLYVFIGRYDYYAILFLPLFIGGLFFLLRARKIPSEIVIGATSIGTCLLIFFHVQSLLYQPGPAREVMQAIEGEVSLHKVSSKGTVLISGPFGHEWQYESHLPLRRYRSEFLTENEVQAVVCLRPCEGIEGKGFLLLGGTPMEVWVRGR